MTARNMLIGAVALLAGSAFAQLPPDLPARVDAVFAEWDTAYTPGAAVGIVQDGQLVFARGYGRATLEYDVPIAPATVFHVASVSKQFTAFAIAMLAEEGLVDLDEDVRVYLHEFPDFGHTITLRHLIHHTSGLRDQWELLMMAGWRIDDVITQDQVLSLIRHQRSLNFEPGTEYLYSNSGYTVMAEIVGRVTGRPFQDWMRERVFEPLGMSATHFHDSHERIVPNRAYSYASTESGFRNAPLNYATFGATSLFTTIEDLARWLRNLEAREVGSHRVHEMMLSRGVLTSGDTLRYAFALSHDEHREEWMLQHGGADAGYRTHLAYFPERRLGIIVLANAATLNAGAAARFVADAVFGHPQMPPQAQPAMEPIDVNPELLRDFAGVYHLASGSRLDFAVHAERLYRRVSARWDPVIPVAPDRFLVGATGQLVRFERDDGGAVVGIRIGAADHELTGTRLFAPPVGELEQYVGTYFSDELGTSYEIVVTEDGLVAEHRRHPPATLAFVGRDEFLGDRWGMSSVRFVRDEKGSVIGLEVSGSRVRNVAFIRRP